MELNTLNWICIAFGVASVLWMSLRQDRIRSLNEQLSNVIAAKVKMAQGKEAAVGEAQKWKLKHDEMLKINANRLEEIAARDAEIAGLNKVCEIRGDSHAAKLGELSESAEAWQKKYCEVLEEKMEVEKLNRSLRSDLDAAEMRYTAEAQRAAKLAAKPKVKVSKARKPANVNPKPKKVAVRTPKKPKEAN